MTEVNNKEHNKEHKVGVFFDYENIVYSLRNRFEQKANFEALIDKCKEFGTLCVAKAFADWGLPYMSPALMYALQSAGFELTFVPTGSTQSNAPRKNVADLYMAVSIMDSLFTRPEIDTFVLMTGDRDFMLLVNYLKQRGKRVIAIGVDGSSSYYLTQAVDDFFYYSEVEEIFEDQPRRQKGRPTNIYDALTQAVRIMHEKGRSPRLTNLKPIMVELMGSFDEKRYTDSKGRNFQKFKDFVSEAQRRGVVRLLRRGAVIEVHLPDANIDKGRKRVTSAELESFDADLIKLDNAFKLLTRAIREAKKEKRSTKFGAIRGRLKKLLSAFDVKNVEDEDGNTPFKTIGDFVEAAEKAGLVTISGEGTRREAHLSEDATATDEESSDAEASVAKADARILTGNEARASVLEALKSYKNYPTSFLSLAGYVHRQNESSGVSVDEVEARDLMTEAVKVDLLHQIVLPDGRRQYELNATDEVVSLFLNEPGKEVATLEDVADVEVEDEVAADESDTAPAFASPYDALVEAVRRILSDGKDPVLPRVKSMLVNLLGSFDEKQHADADGNNFTRFKDFVLDAQKQGYVNLEMDGSINRVFLAENSAESITSDDDVLEAVAELTAAVEEAASEAEVARPAPAKKKPVRKTTPDADLEQIDETAQRQLMVDALRTFSGYPAPFMGILAHCRNLRNDRNVYISSGDLRDLLSETTRVGLVSAVSERGKRPTLYAFTDDATLVQKYVDQEPIEDEAPEVSTTDDTSDTNAVVEAVSEAAAEAAAAALEVAPEPEDPPFDQPAVRAMIVATLSAWDGYPAPFKEVLAQIQYAATEQGLAVNDKQLREQLSASTRAGVLSITSPRGVRPTKYGYANDEAAVAAYLTVAEPEPEAIEEVAAPVEVAAPEASTEEAPAAVDTSNQPEEIATFVNAVQELQSDNEVIKLADVKKRMKKLLKGFDEKKYNDAEGKPFKRFRDFAQMVAGTGLVTLIKQGRTELVELATDAATVAQPATEPEAEAAAPVDEAPVADETVADAPVDDADATSEEVADDPLSAAYALLKQAVSAATESGSSRRLPAIRSRMTKIDAGFDVKNLTDADGKAFKSLPAFMKAAEAAGHVALTGKGNSLEIALA